MRTTRFAIMLLCASVMTSGAAPHSPRPKISEARARRIAQARVPHGQVKSHELEREHGRWIYSYDFTVPGKSGIDEVNVDAYSGKVLAVAHENPKDEQAEAAKEKRESAK
jgi:uncharacterized membrane protein YkoI